MACQHKLCNQHMYFHFLPHNLAGLNENQRLSFQFQQLFYLIMFWRLSQYRKIYCESTKLSQIGPLADTQTAEEAHRSLLKCHGSEISKVVMRLILAWFPSIATLTSRIVFVTKFDS